MNFDPIIPALPATLMALFAASLWGTWFISLKHLGDYPVEAYYITLFFTALVFVWSVSLIIDGNAVFVDIQKLWMIKPSKILVVFTAGVLYAVGLHLSIRVMGLIGLTLSQPLNSAITLLVGQSFAVTVGGLPEGLLISRISIAVIFLLGAVVLVYFAERSKTRAQNTYNIDTGLSRDRNVMVKAVLLMIFAGLFMPAYGIGLSYSLRTITQPDGLAVLPYMSLLSSGAFIGALIVNAPYLARNKKWCCILQAPFRIHRWGLLSGLFHYGGNIIHAFAAGTLSTAVAFPLGLTAGLWTQLWGIRYGEFKGAPRTAYILQAGSFACYIIGAYLIVVK